MSDPLVAKVAKVIHATDYANRLSWDRMPIYMVERVERQAEAAIAVVRAHVAADIESVAPGFTAASEGGFEFGLKTAYVVAKGDRHD